MASGNYFGFTHGGTQYSQPQATTYTAQHATAAAAAQGTAQLFPAQATHPTAAAVYASTATPRQTQTASYDTTYATTQQAGGYGYSTPQRQDPTPARQTTQTYQDSTGYAGFEQTQSTGAFQKQTYYQAQTQQHTNESYFSQRGKMAGGKTGSVYTSGGGSGYGGGHQSMTQKQTQPKVAPVVTYAYAAQTTAPTYATTSSSSYSGQSKYSGGGGGNSSGGGGGGGGNNQYSSYDAAIYSAATNYYQQQQSVKMGNQWGGGGYKGMKKGFQHGNKGPGMKETKAPPQPTQIHYCDVCKISCAGPRTYKEHLEGQKHKKKELASKTGTIVNLPSSRSGVQAYRCELCDVSCTGLDAYNAHIRGSKHQKVHKLHTKLGKPIPSSEPVKIGNQATAGTNSTAGTGKTQTTPSKAAAKPAQPVKKMVTPKITFVGGSKLATTGDGEKKNEQKPAAATPASKATTPTTGSNTEEKEDVDMEKDILPVGEDYIEELKNEEGKLVSFNCKLCECQFNDPNAKEMHMKGRRHRLQYKKKVDPSYPVDIKPSARSRKLQEEKLRRQMAKEEFMRQRQEEFQWREEMRRYEEDMYWRRMEEERYWEERRRFEQEMEYFEWQRRRGVHLPRPLPPKPPVPADGPVMQVKRSETEIDRHVMSKHGSIYPTEQELQLVQNMVSQMEKALKGVSDHIAEEDNPTPPTAAEETKVTVKTEPAIKDGTAPTTPDKKEESDKDPVMPPRVLKGVMRVGVLAKGLLLRGALNMGLVVLCSEKPTRTLLERIANLIPKHLQDITEEKYEIRLCVEEAGLIVTKEPAMTMKISLTSPAFRDQPSPDAADSSRDPPDVLCRQKCLEALAALRHAKWFQARAGGLQSCVVIIRVLRDLCERVPTWAPLRGWPLELLCERVIASAGQPLSPGDALRRVFEAVAGGLLLPGGPGLFDPCEKDEADALAHLAPQECEDITASAQHALRLIVFRQVHKVLAMEPMYSQNRNFNRNRRGNRKRRREDTEGTENGDAEGKKDKKEGDTTTSMETGVPEGTGTE
ncbi:zinc finger RNA-binding protein-like isoform X1 [Lytechinus variegatus]|uniref:zinc finger RNA-binding protein-like isoform X1 n=1 Tax=Lytechinus variegatus TaxID=7654 RepID=UPI001BB1E12A|nr:zinc finger RNA-binding protein-like isoform X1 [Lytechinus variegatus]